MIFATYLGHVDLVDLLLRHGADVNARDAAGNTALMGVCFKGHLEIARILIEHGTDVNAQNSMGATALIYAATYGHSEIVKVLLSHGAAISPKDKEGKTALDHIIDTQITSTPILDLSSVRFLIANCHATSKEYNRLELRKLMQLNI